MHETQTSVNTRNIGSHNRQPVDLELSHQLGRDVNPQAQIKGDQKRDRQDESDHRKNGS